MADRPRYDCDLRFPSRAFVPGRMPHPRRTAANPGSGPLPDDRRQDPDGPGERDRALLQGLDLFNHGYFWEAHEAWEAPWQGLPRDSDDALHLQALIRLAAAALKLVMDEPAGVAAHAAWCAAPFGRLQRSRPEVFRGGPTAQALIALSRRLHERRESLLPGEPRRLATILTLAVPE